MALSIRSKLFWAILLASLLSIGGLGGWMHWQFNHSFLSYLQAQQLRTLESIAVVLAQHFEDQPASRQRELLAKPMLWRDWARPIINQSRQNQSRLIEDDLRDRHDAKHRREARFPWLREPPISRPNQAKKPYFHKRGERSNKLPPPKRREKRSLPPLIEGRITLLDAQQQPIGGGATPEVLVPVTAQGATAGYLGLDLPGHITQRADQAFAQRFGRSLFLAAMVAVALASLLARWLSRQFTRPISALREGSARLAAGELDHRLDVTSSDELGALTKDFNHLASQIEAYERSRQQWVADTAHELRTPLSVLKGELEAMQDGVRAVDTAALSSLHEEIVHLQRLSEDLQQLSTSGETKTSYQFAPLDLAALLRKLLSQQQASFEAVGLRVQANFDTDSTQAMVNGDAGRLRQLFQNLFANSRRYTNAPGELSVRLSVDSSEVKVALEDSAPSVDAALLDRLFERFYRVESSRNRATGGAGLGLSIVKSIVNAHGGEIAAYQSQLGGLGLEIRLPQASA